MVDEEVTEDRQALWTLRNRFDSIVPRPATAMTADAQR
jgi:hypothetical protein